VSAGLLETPAGLLISALIHAAHEVLRGSPRRDFSMTRKPR
jgi:hypothetical protein